MADPTHPDQNAQELVRRLKGIDLTGGAGTAGTSLSPDEATLTVGRASKTKAVAGALASPPGSSLLSAWTAWKASQAPAVEVAKAADAQADIEHAAMKKSARRLAKHLSEGVSAPVACSLAHQHYKAKGGKSTFAVWAQRISTGG